MAKDSREVFLTTRVTPTEHREAGLLARAKGISRSELVRRLVREAAEREVVTSGRHADQ